MLQKAILKSLAVVVSLVLISFTVSAQGFWQSIMENTSFSEIAMAMVENNNANTASADAKSSTDANALEATLEIEEEALKLEEWMTNEANFLPFITIEEEVENPMELENWMVNDKLWEKLMI